MKPAAAHMSQIANALSNIVVIALLMGLIYHYLPAYLGEKGKNLATKEDIAAITERIEAVKIQYGKSLEEHKQQNQLKYAALDRRLEAAQGAFSNWWALFADLYTDQLEQRIQDCQNFWVANCLYLSEEASFAFRSAFLAAGNHEYLQNAAAIDPGTVREVQDNFTRIKAAGEIIAKSVAMPAWTDITTIEPKITKNG